ncbi:MAG: hypothetical protein E4H14_15190 [Candidatus Thorarchaeota archaeon]|nr:MAG: hypothetical protein E4H14_15190 [Candidatus Thorarchaeota archaeon]
MGLSLRIDVDNPFGYASLYKKILNRISLDYNLIPKLSSLGFLDHAKKLRNYLDENSVPTTWFFRNITAPSKTLLKEFRKSPFDLALHAERTDTLQNFTSEVQKWKKNFGTTPKGFSKHGSGDLKLSRMHVMEYDAEAFVDYGVELGFEYFSGNGTAYDSKFENRNGFVYIPAIFWLDNLDLHSKGLSLDDIITLSESKQIVVLVHPFWWGTLKEVRDRLDYLVRHTNFVPLQKQIEEFRDTA